MVQRKITVIEAKEKLKKNDLSDQEIKDILTKLYVLCERVVDKVIEEKYGRS